MKRLFLAVLAVALLAAGCGDDKPSEAQRAGGGKSMRGLDGENPPATNPDGSPAKPADGGAGNPGANPPATNPDGTPANPAPGAPGAPGSTTTRAPFPVKHSVEKPCVRKGPAGDFQVLVVATRPGDTIGYSTEYSDRSNELSNPAYKSGSGHGKADTSGNFRTEWRVPDIAPNGTARLHVIADGRILPALEFRVVGPTDSC